MSVYWPGESDFWALELDYLLIHDFAISNSVTLGT